MSASEDDIGSQFMEHKVASEDEAAYNQEMERRSWGRNQLRAS
jgi:hypothetical protein